jgi:hypothetical protein
MSQEAPKRRDLALPRLACSYALTPDVMITSLYVGAVVGTLLNLINQGDALLRGSDLNYAKLVLTYVVPYCVATYGAVSVRLRDRKRADKA